MAKFIAVTGRADEGPLLINFDHVARIGPRTSKDKTGARLTFSDGDTLNVQEDFEMLARMVETSTAKGT